MRLGWGGSSSVENLASEARSASSPNEARRVHHEGEALGKAVGLCSASSHDNNSDADGDSRRPLRESVRRSIRSLALRHPRLSAFLLLILFLGLWGAWAGPSWTLQPLTNVVVPPTTNTQINGGKIHTPVGAYEVSLEEITVRLADGSELPVRVRRPLGVNGLTPGIVFIHGTGTASSTSFSREAEALTSAGITTIVAEKRTENYSTTFRDYRALARDYADVFEIFIEMTGVDPHRSGLYAVSEGAYIAPIVATSIDSVSFVTFVSAPVFPIREQGALAAGTYLKNLGAPKSIIDAIPRLIGQDFGEDFQYIDFNISDYQQQMDQPVLMLYGTGDMSMPTVQGPERMREDLAANGNTDLTVRYYENADHGLRVDKVLVSTAMRDTADWVNGLPGTASALPHVAGAQPHQLFEAAQLDQPHWFASGHLGIVIMLSGIGLTAISIPLTAFAWLRRGHRRPMDLSGIAGKMNVASLALLTAVVVALAYIVLIAVLALSYRHNAPLVQGGWMFTQAVALVAAWLVVREIFAFATSVLNREKRPCGVRIVAGIAVLGQLVVLLSLAYWGFYPALIR